MYSGQDRRTAERRESDFHVQITAPTPGDGHIQDVSAGGALIVLTDLPKQGEMVSLSWSVEDGAMPIVIDAQVAWSMKGDGATSVSAIGVQWKSLRAPSPNALKSLLKDILQVSGGFAKMVPAEGQTPSYVHFTFPELSAGTPKETAAATEEAEESVESTPDAEVPEAPAPSGTPSPDDSPSVGLSGHVMLPTKYKTQGKSLRGTIVTLAERRAVIETENELPSHSDRVELKVSIPSTEGVLPLKIYGQVSRTRPATDSRNASFWVLVTRVDECGRSGLFRQYVEHIA